MMDNPIPHTSSRNRSGRATLPDTLTHGGTLIMCWEVVPVPATPCIAEGLAGAGAGGVEPALGVASARAH